MRERPTSITVISWILIVLGSISLVSMSVMIGDPIAEDLMSKSALPISLQYVITYLGILVTIGSGIGMLKGWSAARWAYVLWSIASFIVGLATSPMKAAMIPGILGFAVIAFFLFRPGANAYFASTETVANA